jgi:hypothetical protein
MRKDADKIGLHMFVTNRKMYNVPYAIYIYSEWVIVAKRQFSNFSAISWREQVNFQCDVDEICFVLEKHAKLDF